MSWSREADRVTEVRRCLSSSALQFFTHIFEKKVNVLEQVRLNWLKERIRAYFIAELNQAQLVTKVRLTFIYNCRFKNAYYMQYRHSNQYKKMSSHSMYRKSQRSCRVPRLWKLKWDQLKPEKSLSWTASGRLVRNLGGRYHGLEVYDRGNRATPLNL